MNSAIVIDVRATNNCVGKTTVSVLIHKALQEAGLDNVTVACMDQDFLIKAQHLDQAVEGVRGKQPMIFIRDVSDRLIDPERDKAPRYASKEELTETLSRISNRIIDNSANRERIDRLVQHLSSVVDEKDYVMIDREGLTEIEDLLESLYVQDRLDISADSVMELSGDTKPPHPADFIQEDIMDPARLTVSQLASKLGCDAHYLQSVLAMKSPVSPVLARQLERAGYSTVRVWLETQHKWNLHEAAQLAQEEAENLEHGTFVLSTDK